MTPPKRQLQGEKALVSIGPPQQTLNERSLTVSTGSEAWISGAAKVSGKGTADILPAEVKEWMVE